MKRILLTSLLLLASNFIKGLNSYRMSSIDLTKLKITMWYLQSIKTLRLLFISLLGLGVCLIFLISGLVCFSVALLVYAPLAVTVKMSLAFLLAVVYIAMGLGIFFYLFSDEKWIKIFNVDHFIKELTENTRSDAPVQRNGNPSHEEEYSV